MKDCYKQVKSIDFDLPSREEILLQNWDKVYYGNQWTAEVQKISCSFNISITECKNVIEYLGRENLVPIIDKLMKVLEFSIEILIEAQGQANNLLDKGCKTQDLINKSLLAEPFSHSYFFLT